MSKEIKYEWFEAPKSADQAALFRDGVQIGNWYFSYKLYRKYDAKAKAWGKNAKPPVEPPESLTALRLSKVEWQVMDYPKKETRQVQPIPYPPVLVEKTTGTDYNMWFLLLALGLGVILWKRR